MELIVSDKMDVLNYISDPKNLKRALVDSDKTFDLIKQLRDFTDDHAVMTSNGRIAGGSGNLKLIARVPESVMIVALAVEPNLLKDRKLLWKWLDANPQFAAYTRKRGRTK